MSFCRLILINIFLLTFFAFEIHAAKEVRENVGEDIQDAITMLIGGNSRERVDAVKALTEFSPEDLISYGAWGPFTNILREDGPPHVQKEVIIALGIQGRDATEYTKRKIVGLVTKTIKNEKLHLVVRSEAIVAIGHLITEDTPERQTMGKYLEKYLKSKNSILWKAIMGTLTLWKWDLGDRIWSEVVSNDPVTRKTAIRALKNEIVMNGLKIDTLKAKGLLSIIESEQRKKDLRIDLLNIVTFAVKNGSKVPAFTHTLEKIISKNTNNLVTFAAVDAIGRTSNPNLIKLLLDVFEKHKYYEENAEIRVAVCSAAGDFISLIAGSGGYLNRYKSDLNKLVEVLVSVVMYDENNSVRKEAAYALGNLFSKKLDRKKPVLTLINAIADPDLSMSKIAINSLTFLTQQDFGSDLKTWQKWYRENKSKLGPQY